MDDQLRISSSPVNLANEVNLQGTKVGLLQPLPVPDQPLYNISMDFTMGLPLTPRKNDAVFTFVDRLTKYVHLIPTTSTINAEGAAELYVKHVFSAHGLS